MDIFEKQETIEAIKTVIKARWFYVLAIAGQALIVKLFFPLVPLPTNWLLMIVVGGVLTFNFIFWLYLRRKPEKVGFSMLKIIKFSQVPLDQAGLAAGFYFSGTANKLMIIMFVIPIIVGSAIYKEKGIILTAFSTMVIYSGLVMLEYFGLMPYVPPEAAAQLPTKLLRGDWQLTRSQLIGFNFYFLGVAFYAGYLSNLFKLREKRLISQKNELVQKTGTLFHQTQELTHAKDEIQSAFTKSDVARRAATQAREEMEKANLELKKKIDELEKFYKITVGREVRIAEMKSQVKKLEGTIKKMEDKLSKK